MWQKLYRDPFTGLRLTEVGVEFLERCRDFLYHPGISVVRDAQVALGAGRVSAMHDPTEGGVATDF